jgi:hypothetical protein
VGARNGGADDLRVYAAEKYVSAEEIENRLGDGAGFPGD